MKLNELSTESRLWLYQSNRKFDQTEKTWLNERLEEFAEGWAAHGKDLKAAGEVISDCFIALAVDGSQGDASGCSIDTSVHFVKELGNELNVDFFDRTKVWVEEGQQFELIPFRDLKSKSGARFLNPMLTRLGDLSDKFAVTVEEFYETV
ncbi:MAG: hypothetical protein EP338_05175 [Bacteroidetes bacterium]|nr:MAG: hypothetical protein EP338_05175 [Bacteroidota bacterium]